MFKYLILGLVIFAAYQYFNRKETPIAQKRRDPEASSQRPGGNSDDEYVDYEEVE